MSSFGDFVREFTGRMKVEPASPDSPFDETEAAKHAPLGVVQPAGPVFTGVLAPSDSGQCYTAARVAPGVEAEAPLSDSREADPANPFGLDLGKPIARKDRWRFLTGVPFTRRMLEIAAERWGEPLDTNDLADIETGTHFLFERRQSLLAELLNQWADDNPAKLNELTAEVYDCDRVTGNPFMVRESDRPV